MSVLPLVSGIHTRENIADAARTIPWVKNKPWRPNMVIRLGTNLTKMNTVMHLNEGMHYNSSNLPSKQFPVLTRPGVT